MIRHSFRGKILLIFMGTMLFNTFFLIAYIRLSGEKFLYSQKDRSIYNLMDILEKYFLRDLALRDYSNLKTTLEDIIRSEAEIQTLRIYDGSGTPVAYARDGDSPDFLGLSGPIDLEALSSYEATPLPDKTQAFHARLLSDGGNTAGALIVQYSRKILSDRAFHVVSLLLIHTIAVQLLGLAVFYLVLRKISRPILDISRLMKRYGEEDFDFSYDYARDDEIGALNHSIRKMSEQVKLSIDLLQKSEERFELAVQGSHDGIWDYDPLQDSLYISPRGRDIIMCGRARLQTLNDGIARITEEDKDILKKAIHCLENNGCDILDVECRVRQKGKKPKWIRIKGKGVFNGRHKCIRIAGSLSDINQQKLSEDKLIRAAMYDILTSLPNRLYLLDRLQQIIKNHSREPGRHYALLFLDYDGFKKVNDTYGHATGDEILRLIAQRLKRCLRPQDLISRIGGDEFVILLEDCGTRDDVSRIAGRILESSAREFQVDEYGIFLTVSIGIAMDDLGRHNQDELIQFSDIAMYHAKNSGKGVFAFYREEMQTRIRNEWRIQNDIHRAIENGELYLVYQPVVNLSDNRIRGAEVLMRWKHPSRGEISPADFIPSSEESGFITQLTDWLIGELHREKVHTFTNSAGEPVRISFNLSTKDFINNPPILKRIQSRFSYGSPHTASLDVEVTETTLIDNLETVCHQLSQLQAMGMKIKLDDFGTGYSSLSYLHNFPLDELKIDRSFVSSLTQSKRKRNIIRHIINLAHDLDLKVIAEGIESMEEQGILRDMGCDMGQGYYYSPPVKIGEFQAMLSGASSSLTGGETKNLVI